MPSHDVDLNLVRAFVAVHDAGSFSLAAARLGVPRSTLSRAVAALEAALGVTLFQRTTRRVSATSAADALYGRVAPSMASLESSFSDLPDANAAPSGVLRVTTTVDFGAIVLAETIARYTQRYPRVRVETVLTTDMLDLVKDSVDVAVRFSTRPLRDSSLVARKVGRVVGRMYASPAYLARRGVPRTPADLHAHDWIAYRGGPAIQFREASARSSSKARIALTPRVTGDSMWFLREVLKAGAGIGEVPSFVADPDVAAGALVHVLPKWIALSGNVYVLYPSSKHVPPRVAAFCDLLVEMLRQRPIGADG